MKKIFSFIMAVLMIVGCCVYTVSAEELADYDREELERLFIEYSKSLFAPDAINDDDVIIHEVIFADDLLIFTGDCEWIDPGSAPYRTWIGDYTVVRQRLGTVTPLGVYVKYGDIIYPFERVEYETGIVIDPTILLNFAGFEVFKEEIIIKGDGKFEKLFVERLELGYDEAGELNNEYYYEEIYEYYSTPVGSSEEATPDYALVFAVNTFYGPAIYREYVGKYIVISMNFYHPYELGYFIYLPAEDKIYTLKEAYDKGIEGIENVFTEADIMCGVFGDADKDGRLTVKDATWIQKRVAGINVESLYENDTLIDPLLDFDKNYSVNVKDATAIQKYIAGLEY